MSISMGDRGPYESPEGAVVGNEFAEVAVEIDAQGNSTRLRVTDLKTERVLLRVWSRGGSRFLVIAGK